MKEQSGEPLKKVRIMKRGGIGGRGFHQYGQPFLCTYGTTIDVYESSAASGPHCWLKLENGPDLKGGEAVAHLNPQQARALIARLQTWLDEIPSRWGASR